MGCSSCGSGSPSGCGDKGHCSTGGCNMRNTYDWISVLDIHDPSEFNLVEVSFKKGARKDFYINQHWTGAGTGDTVVVECDSGLDVGRISLSGELVRLQMKKKRTTIDRVSHKIIRKVNDRDLEKLSEARDLERPTLVRARVIARTLGLDMKLGDIEYQADKRKATFYYTANGRVDFRELVRSYAKEFKIKVEMRQIGARQESARIGGIGSCGRELCCSTWLSDFQSVNTSAARYQNIAINQTKLSGQCGRLKCCLNYELDTYMDALKDFPKNVDYIKTKKGKAALIKTDIFKGMMFYAYIGERRGPIVALDKDRVKEIKTMNKAGEFPDDLMSYDQIMQESKTDKEIEFADVTGEIELPSIKKNKRKKRRPNNRNKGNNKQENRQKQGGRSNDQRKKSNSNNNSNKSKSNNNTANKSKSNTANSSNNKSDTNAKKQGDNATGKSNTGGKKPNRRRPNNRKNNQNNKGNQNTNNQSQKDKGTDKS